MTRISRKLRRFAGDQSGSYAIEGILILPLLMWAVMASVVFVDAYRMQAMNLRATYVISDAVSRMWDPVTDDYFEGLWRLHGLQVNYAHPTHLRMSALQWSEDDDEYMLRWSETTSNSVLPALEQEMIDDRVATIPELADGDTLVLVETQMDYSPLFSIGLPEMTFHNELFVSPRYTPQIVYQGS